MIHGGQVCVATQVAAQSDAAQSMADFCTELCFDEAPGFAMLMPSHGVVKVLQR
jgi:hypothetical protein